MTVIATARLAFAHHRGGGPYTRWVSQRVGSVVAVLAVRLRLTPDALTTANLLLGLGASLLVAGVGSIAGTVVAAVLWQLAYACDCADGQLARWKGMGTPHGKAYDLLCDYVVQLSFATVVLARSGKHSPQVLIPVAGVFLLGTFFAGLAEEHLPRTNGPVGSSSQRSAVRAAVVLASRACRDYGLVTLVVGVSLCFRTEVPLVVLAAAGTLNVVSTAARVAPVLSLRAKRPTVQATSAPDLRHRISR